MYRNEQVEDELEITLQCWGSWHHVSVDSEGVYCAALCIPHAVVFVAVGVFEECPCLSVWDSSCFLNLWISQIQVVNKNIGSPNLLSNCWYSPRKSAFQLITCVCLHPGWVSLFSPLLWVWYFVYFTSYLNFRQSSPDFNIANSCFLQPHDW